MRYLLPCLLLSLPLSVHASGFDDLLKKATEAVEVLQPQTTETPVIVEADEGATANTSNTSFVDALTSSEISDGLKEALKQGTDIAISTLSAAGGFASSSYKITVPKGLARLETILRKIGQNKIVDDFISSMNKAAEDAIPEVSQIFNQAIDKMSLADASNILKGNDDAATEYFKKNTQTDLIAKISPLIKKSMDANGVSASYKTLMDTAKNNGGGLITTLLGNDSQDINAYVTTESLNALFSRIAAEEKKIRSNPIARGTDLLKKVFSFN